MSMAHSTRLKEKLQQDKTDSKNIEPLQELDTDETYYIGCQKKGVALIFNNFEFDNERLNSQQNSASADGERLEKLLRNLNFDVRLHLNLKLEELQKKIKDVALEKHNEWDCLLVIILTKGADGKLCARDYQYDDHEVWKAFMKAPSLIGKPKIFLIQSDEGKILKKVVGMQLLSSAKIEEKDPAFLIPKSADYFIYHAPIKRTQSSVSDNKGSLFVQEFCSRLEKYASKEDLTTIMMHVSRKLSKQIHKADENGMPVSTSSLTKLLYLRKRT